MNIKKGKDEVFFILLLLSMPAIEELWQLLTGKIDKKEFYNRFKKEKYKIISNRQLIPPFTIFYKWRNFNIPGK